MSGVMSPGRRGGTGAIDAVLAGLQVASQVYGMKQAGDQADRLREELEMKKAGEAENVQARADFKAGKLNKGQQIELGAKGLVPAKDGEAGAFSFVDADTGLTSWVKKQNAPKISPPTYKDYQGRDGSIVRVEADGTTRDLRKGKGGTGGGQKETWTKSGEFDEQGNMILMSNLGNTKAGPKAGKNPGDAEKPPTGEQLGAANFGRKAQDADAIVRKLEEGGYDPASFGRAARDLPLLGAVTKNPQDRQYVQAQKEFIAAILRKESGGAITPDEFTEYGKIYFPQAGDDPDTIAQKAASRAAASENLIAMAGTKAAGQIANRAPLAPGKADTSGTAIAAPAKPAKADADDAQALAWAKANPQDPRSAAIIESLKARKLIGGDEPADRPQAGGKR